MIDDGEIDKGLFARLAGWLKRTMLDLVGVRNEIQTLCAHCWYPIGRVIAHTEDGKERCWGPSRHDMRCWVGCHPPGDAVRFESWSVYRRLKP